MLTLLGKSLDIAYFVLDTKTKFGMGLKKKWYVSMAQNL